MEEIYYIIVLILFIKNISIKDFEIIVVDNGSTDNSINRVKSNFQNVEIISSNSNLG
ncbi:MAG: hypothetical protein CM1200mP31_0710 [Candidatus Neomarinimicrobiota bacterium]|nr:MAG: hypothetical protein CM1200mP31_0710 [Candidatus Neomarinimicrobiota bacterium]